MSHSSRYSRLFQHTVVGGLVLETRLEAELAPAEAEEMMDVKVPLLYVDVEKEVNVEMKEEFNGACVLAE